MARPAFRQRMVDGVFDEHVRPINQFVEALRDDPSGRGWVPYVAPAYGGTEAELLLLFSDPGPMTNSASGGSGFLCVENDDPSAERLCEMLHLAGIDQSRTVGWNAYPWFRHGDDEEIRAPHIEAGLEPLIALLEMLPSLRVVMLMGGNAQWSWRKLRRRNRTLAERWPVVETFHTSNRAFAGVSGEERQGRLAQLARDFREAGRLLGRA